MKPHPDRNRLRQLAHEYGVDMLVLFGSQAAGTKHKSSDVDIAYLAGKRELSLREESMLAAGLAEAIRGGRIDLVPLRQASPLLAFQIARDGKLLYAAKKSLFSEFQLRAIRLYNESKPLIELRKERIQHKVKGYGL